MKNLVMAAAAVALMTATPAQAVTRQIDFSFGFRLIHLWEPPFRRMPVDTFSGSFSFDDSGFGWPGSYDLQPSLQSLSVSNGTKSWGVDDVSPVASQIAFDALGQVISWSFRVSGPDGMISANSSRRSFIQPSDGYLAFCGPCASFQEVPVSMSAVPVPLPSGIGLLAAGLGGLGALGLRRRKTV